MAYPADEVRTRRSLRTVPGLRGVGLSLGIVAILVVSSNGFSMPTASVAPTFSKLSQFDSKVSHIVFLLQENHAYDNFYGTYCQVSGKYCPSVGNGIPTGTCVPYYPTNLSRGCAKPFPFTAQGLTIPDLPHDWRSTHLAYNGGAMNNFYTAEANHNNTFGYYNATTIPVYWDLAEEYGLGDNFYSPAASYSLPNHWFAVAGAAPNISYTVKTEVAGTSVKDLHTYLNQSNATPAIEDRLNHSKVSWKYYDFALGNYTWSTVPAPNSPAYSYWNPMAAREQSYTWGPRKHFVPRNDFFTDAKNGSLPNISWVIPTPPESDHPSENLSTGESWVASVVDAIEASPEWNSTVLFISWDEYGGFYDHVPPPILDTRGDGFRVPVVVVGPYVTQGVINHQQLDFDSILHLMENRFHLKCLSNRDCNATLPLNFFNFNKTARAPIYIPDYANATYPMPLQSSGKLPPYLPKSAPMAAFASPEMATPSDLIDWS